MSSTYTQILYQIVFSTKHRVPALEENNREKLYKYIWGILKNKKCHLYQINGMEDHLHIATHIHPTIALSTLVKDIKVSSNLFIKEENLFPDFNEWQGGYGAFTYSQSDKDRLITYIKNQQEHHQKITFKEEYENLLNERNVDYDKEYLF
jgi:REP element-mobilizing transposase RayT